MTKLVTGLKTNRSQKLRAKSLPACCNPRLSFDLRFLWTVEVDGCLCSCRIVVFSPTAPIIADRISKYGTITVKGAARNGKRASTKSLQPLFAVLIPEVESTIRSSSCKCVMDLQQVLKKKYTFPNSTLPQTPHSAGSLRHWVRPFYSQIQHHQLRCPSLEPTAIPKLGNSHKQVGTACSMKCLQVQPTKLVYNIINQTYHYNGQVAKKNIAK